MQNAEQFYNELAENYDEATNFDERLKASETFVEKLLGRHDISSILDTGCGSGCYSIACAKQELKTVGSDLSTEMLKKARENADENYVAIDFFNKSLQQSGDIPGSFDCILCMGNTLPHLDNPNEFHQTLETLSKKLNEDGVLYIQLLNYAHILAEKQRIISINKTGCMEYIRFNDFDLLNGKIRFNILTIDWSHPDPVHDLKSTELMPFTVDQINEHLPDTLNLHNVFKGNSFSNADSDSSSLLLEIGRT